MHSCLGFFSLLFQKVSTPLASSLRSPEARSHSEKTNLGLWKRRPLSVAKKRLSLSSGISSPVPGAHFPGGTCDKLLCGPVGPAGPPEENDGRRFRWRMLFELKDFRVGG